MCKHPHVQTPLCVQTLSPLCCIHVVHTFRTYSATAALFAKKKDKKKKFKPFNANKIDASSVTKKAMTHVDDKPAVSVAAVDDGWEETTVKKKSLVSGTIKLKDFSVEQDKARKLEDNISERVRIDETRKQLEAVRLKASTAGTDDAPAPAAAAAPAAADSTPADGGAPKKWTPSFKSNRGPAAMPEAPTGGGGVGGARFNTRFGADGAAAGGSSSGANTAGGFRKVDTSDTSAFPTLGGGAPVTVAGGAWGAPKEEEQEQAAETVFKFAEGGEEAAVAEGEEGEEKKEKKKKKKKDLSAFM